MADTALININGNFDLDLGDGGSAVDESLRTAVILSLFTDRRAKEDDVLPDGTDDRRGWWGDIYPDTDGDLMGSRLWLLDREKELQSVVRRAEEYGREALAWIVEDGLAAGVEVSGSIPASGALLLEVVITLANGDQEAYRATLPYTVQAQYTAGALTDEGGQVLTDEAGNVIFEEM